MNIQEQIAAKLRNDHHIHISDEWLQQCLEYLRIHGPNSREVQELTRFVWTKFLDFDLSLSKAMPVLPTSTDQPIYTQHRVILFQNTHVVLQVNQIINIASSRSNQQKRKMDLSNKASSSDNPVLLIENEIQEDDAEVGKMNKLLITDGFSQIVALDLYGVCASVKNASPGMKICCSNVLVRKGVLMLDFNNCKILGGVVNTFHPIAMTTQQIMNQNPIAYMAPVANLTPVNVPMVTSAPSSSSNQHVPITSITPAPIMPPPSLPSLPRPSLSSSFLPSVSNLSSSGIAISNNSRMDICDLTDSFHSNPPLPSMTNMSKSNIGTVPQREMSSTNNNIFPSRSEDEDMMNFEPDFYQPFEEPQMDIEPAPQISKSTNLSNENLDTLSLSPIRPSLNTSDATNISMRSENGALFDSQQPPPKQSTPPTTTSKLSLNKVILPSTKKNDVEVLEIDDDDIFMDFAPVDEKFLLTYTHKFVNTNNPTTTWIRGFAGKLCRFKLAKDTSKKYYFEVVVEFDDGVTIVPAAISPSFCERFLQVSAEQFKRQIATSTDAADDTKQLMLKFQCLHGIFEVRKLTESEQNSMKNNPVMMLLNLATPETTKLILNAYQRK